MRLSGVDAKTFLVGGKSTESDIFRFVSVSMGFVIDEIFEIETGSAFAGVTGDSVVNVGEKLEVEVIFGTGFGIACLIASMSS